MTEKGKGSGTIVVGDNRPAQPERAYVVRTAGGSSASARRKDLERLLSDPAFFRTLTDGMPDVGFIVDLEGNFVYASAAAEVLTGYTPEQLRRMNMGDVVEPHVLASLQKRMERRIRGENLGDLELEIVARDGTRRIVELRTSPIVDEGGRLLGVHGIVRDITARRRAERESRRRAEYLRALAELSKLLLETQDDVPLEEAFGVLGRAAHVSVVRLFEHVKDEQGSVVAVERASWCASGEGDPCRGRTLFTWEDVELETLARKIGKSGTFSGSLASIFAASADPKSSQHRGTVAVIAVQEPLEEFGFAVFGDRDENRTWSEWELDFLRTGTHLIAQASMRARMRRVEHLLARFGEAVAGVDSREKLAQVLASFTKEHFGWDAFVLALRSIAPGQPDFLYMVDTDENGRQIEEQRDWWTPESLGPRAKRILAGEPLLINRRRLEDTRPLETFGYTQRKSASLMFVPIAGRQQVEGMLSVQTYRHFDYSREDLRCLQRLANMAALVLGRLRTQAALHGTRERFRSIVDMVDAYLWSADVEGTFPDWRISYTLYTSGVERITGISREEFLREGSSLWLQMIHADDRPKIEGLLAQLARGKKVTAVYRVQPPDGEVRWVRDSVVPTVDTQGRVVRLDGLCLDVTEEQTTALERDQLYQAVDRAAEAIVLLAPAGIVEYANKAFSQLTGVPGNAAKGMRWYELGLFDDELNRQKRKILRALRERGVWTGRTELRSRSRAVPVEITVSAVKDTEGTVRHWVVTIRDMSEQVALEEQLRQSQKLEAIGTLAAGIAHDFNNLLTGILGNIELAAMEAPAELQEYFDDARRVARRAADLVRQLLAFARKAPGTKQPLALGPIVKETVKLLGETVDRRIAVRVDVPEDLWVVEGDPVQMQQLVMNLCVNARDALTECLSKPDCKAARQGGLAIQVAVENIDASQAHLSFLDDPNGKYVKITVRDNGPGMSEETRRRIFEPFFTTKEVGKGTGLGLATVYGIVTQLGGSIRVDSAPGQGAVFEVFLPAAAEGYVPQMEWKTPPEEVSAENQGEGTILVIDDEESVRSYVARMLRRVGYRVIEAANGKEGVRIFRQNKEDVDLVILDLIMPAMGGEETLAAIRELCPDTKVMMLSGTWDAALLRRLRKSGRVQFFEKPPETNSFLRAVHKTLHEER